MMKLSCCLLLVVLSIAILLCCSLVQGQNETREVKAISEVPEIATLTQTIYEGDDDKVKVLKKLFNDRNTAGFIEYWKTSGLTPNFKDIYGRGFNHWIVGANLLVNDVPWKAISPINVYFAANHEAAVEWDMKDVTGHTGLHYSVLYDKQAYVQILLARGASASVTNPEGKTSLHMSAELGLTATTNLLLRGSDRQEPAPTEVLYMSDKTGYTPLHYAAAADFEQVAELLTRHVPHPEHYIMYEPADFANLSSPFHLAIAKGSLEVVRVFLDFLESTADLLKPNPSGSLPLQIAAMFGYDKIVKLLVDRFRRSDISYACFEDSNGRNAVHYAARFGHLEVIRIILKRMNQNQKEECIYHEANNGWTPLHFAARYHHNSILDFFLKISTKGIDTKQENGLTAFQLAAVGCRLSTDAAVVKLLIRAGADLSIGSSPSPLESCQDRKCSSCVTAIKEADTPDESFKFPPECDLSEASSPFSLVPTADRTKTLSGEKTCGVPVVETGRQLCFFVEVIDYTGFESPSDGFPIGLGVAIDEYIVSVPASMFVTIDELFNRKTLSSNGNYAIKSPGRKGASGQGRYIKVDGFPTVHSAFSPSSIENDLAFLVLEDALSEFEDGVCFLCLPVEEVPLGCLKDVCFVVSPDSGTVSGAASPAKSQSPWSKYTPTLLSTAYCAKETAPLGIRPSDNHVCVENTEEPVQCGKSSSVLICQKDRVVRLYGHQVFPAVSKAEESPGCSSGKVHGVFTSLQTAGARSFYQTALPPLLG